MTDEQRTVEPDGTTEYAASLRPPGESLRGGPDDGVDFGAEEDPEAAATDAEVRRAGYDAYATSGDTDAVRPE